MPTIVLPQQESTGEKWARAGVSLGQAVGGIAELMFALEQRRAQKERQETTEAIGALKLFGDDPNAAPLEVQQKLLDTFGVKGVVKDPVTGKYVFPRSASADLASNKAAFEGEIYKKAMQDPNDPQARHEAMVASGLEKPAPSEFEQGLEVAKLDMRQREIEGKKASSWVAAQARIISANIGRETELMKQQAITNRDIMKQSAAMQRAIINRGALDKESGLYGVPGSGKLFNRPSEAIAFAESAGLDASRVTPLTNEEASMTLGTLAKGLDIEEQDISNQKLGVELKSMLEFGPTKDMIKTATEVAKQGDEATATMLMRGVTGTLVEDLVKRGFDPRAFASPDYWFDDPELQELIGPRATQLLAEAASRLPERQDEDDDESLARDAVGFDTTTGRAIFPIGRDPVPPVKREPQENPLDVIKTPLIEQFRQGAEMGMSAQDVRTQMLISAQQLLPGAPFESIKAVVDSAMQESLSTAVRGVE